MMNNIILYLPWYTIDQWRFLCKSLSRPIPYAFTVFAINTIYQC
jgi:hypothetical protein